MMLICAGWGEPGGEWTEWGWQRELIPQVRWCILRRAVDSWSPFVCSGSILPAVCLVATGFIKNNAPLAVFLVTTAIGLSGISCACWPVNQLDLAPRYAGETIHRTSVSLSLYFWARSLSYSNMHRLKGELNEHNITKVRHRAYSLDKNTIFIWVIWLSRRWWRLTAFMTVNFSTLGNWTITVSN